MNQKIDPGLNFFGHSVDAGMKMDDLKQFLTVVDDFLIEMEKRFEGQQHSIGIDRSYMFSEPFPSILYSSVITSSVSFLEREVCGYSKALKDASEASLSVRDLSGSWLERFRKYCEKVVGIELRLEDNLWQDTKGVVEIRNCLVHAGGYLPSFQKRGAIETFCKRYSLSSLTGDFIEPDRHLTELALNILKQFIDRIYDAALARYPYESGKLKR